MERLDLSLEVKAQELASNLEYSPESRLRTTHTETMWKYRAYQGGEPAASIDWKQSAKGREIYVREHEKITHRDIYFWSSFKGVEETREHALLVLLALAHILVKKERKVGWLSPDLPLTQTNSLIARLFERTLGETGKEGPDPTTFKLHKALIILAADIKEPCEALHEAVHAYASQGNRGIILNLGSPRERSANKIMQTAYNAGWPVIDLDRNDRADTTLTHLLEKTVQATR